MYSCCWFHPAVNRDYGEARKVVTFTPDSRGPLCHSVPIIQDDILEDTESFTVELHKVNEELGYGLNPRTTRVVLEDRNSEFEARDLYTHTVVHTYICTYAYIHVHQLWASTQWNGMESGIGWNGME